MLLFPVSAYCISNHWEKKNLFATLKIFQISDSHHKEKIGEMGQKYCGHN